MCWGAPRIHGELRLLGIEVSQSTVATYMVRHRKPPSQTCRTFLVNHVADLVSVDFFRVPTATIKILYVFVILKHDRREVVHFNVTQNLTAQWTAQQIVKAFPFDTAPRHLLRDPDSTYGERFCRRVKSLGIEEIKTAPRSPWKNPYAERLIGSIRRESLNHVIVLNECHLPRQLQSFFTYYQKARTHLSLAKQSPRPRAVESPDKGHVIAFTHIDGLHHEYRRAV